MRAVVNELVESYRKHEAIIKIDAKDQISREVIAEILGDLRKLFFAGFFGVKRLKEDWLEYYVGELLEQIVYNLRKQSRRALRAVGFESGRAAREAERIADGFAAKLPEIRELLAADVDAAYDGDPAAASKDDVILSYPGLYAIMVYRVAHELHLAGTPLIPRMMTEHAHGLTGIDIHPGASIGHHFFMDHGTGIVVGETAVIGNHVKIYQGVTLGALSTRGGHMLTGTKRHPTIMDNVTIYSGASILGGETVIEEGAVIGSNAFITSSVKKKTKVSVRNPELEYDR
jgi:serine O-acetyltransferase